MGHDDFTIWMLLMGILVWPEFTFGFLLWSLGHPALGLLAVLLNGKSFSKVIFSMIKRNWK